MRSPTSFSRSLAPMLVGTLLVSGPAPAADGPDSVPLIPRATLFGNPDRAGVQISPDGTQVSWLAPVEGVLNVWVAPVGDLSAAKAVTEDTDRGVRQYFWMPNSTHLVYLQDRGGDENWRAYSVDLATGEELDLTPLDGVRATIAHVSRDFPDTLAIGLNDRDPQYHDIHLVNAATGERTLLFENPRFADVTLDDAMQVRLVSEMNPDGSQATFLVEGEAYAPFDTVPFEDTMGTRSVGLDRKGERLFMVDSRGRDKSALTVRNLASGKAEVIFEGTRADVSGALVDPITDEIEAVASTYLKPEWTVLDQAMRKDLDYLRTLQEGEIGIGSRSLDDSKWIVSFREDAGPTVFYLYDRSAGSATRLFTSKDALEGLPLVPMRGVEIPTRDGLTLPGYVSLPKWSDPDGDGKPNEPLPTVL
ncbi:MAG: S9 family peptidase, partial [Phycisphaerales bacterium]